MERRLLYVNRRLGHECVDWVANASIGKWKAYNPLRYSLSPPMQPQKRKLTDRLKVVNNDFFDGFVTVLAEIVDSSALIVAALAIEEIAGCSTFATSIVACRKPEILVDLTVVAASAGCSTFATSIVACRESEILVGLIMLSTAITVSPCNAIFKTSLSGHIHSSCMRWGPLS